MILYHHDFRHGLRSGSELLKNSSARTKSLFETISNTDNVNQQADFDLDATQRLSPRIKNILFIQWLDGWVGQDYLLAGKIGGIPEKVI